MNNELREKIIDEIQWHRPGNGQSEKTADRILALLPEQGQGWRLASEPPDSGRPVLISDGFGCYAASWDGHNQQWLFQGTGNPARDITHWRELPPPPSPATAIETKAAEGFKADDMQPMSLANSYMKGRADAVNDMLEMEQAIQAKAAEIARPAGEVERTQKLYDNLCVQYDAVEQERTRLMLGQQEPYNRAVPTPPATGEKQDQPKPSVISVRFEGGPRNGQQFKIGTDAVFDNYVRVRRSNSTGGEWVMVFDGQPLPHGQDRNVTVADMLRLAEAYRAKGVYAQANCIDEVFKGVS